MDLEWQSAEEFPKTALDLAGLFQKKFNDFSSQCTYQNTDREMKLDADAAFIPSRMRFLPPQLRQVVSLVLGLMYLRRSPCIVPQRPSRNLGCLCQQIEG